MIFSKLGSWFFRRFSRLVLWLHHIDYAYCLPVLARLPVSVSFAIGYVRGKLNAALGRDWRSVALGTRHVLRMSLEGYRKLPVLSNKEQQIQWTRQRFEIESREELEGCWVAAHRLHQLSCTYQSLERLQQRSRNSRGGLILLTPHMESFFVGVGFLAQIMTTRVNVMSSAVCKDPRLDIAVIQHFQQKYRGLEYYLNGGLVLDMETGLRPFYRMLERQETLVVLADAPVTPQGAAMDVEFLGGVRELAGGALRLAQHTQSTLGGFICRYKGMGRYSMEFCELGSADDPETITKIYRYFSEAILAEPGKWWAADMLPHMPLKSF